MNTALVTLDPVAPDAGAIARAADLIRAGHLVAFPTETVYGLGANALDPAAVRGIFQAKGRPASNPLIVHVPDPAGVLNVAAEWPATAARLAERFWPGPLTIVVPKKPGVPDEVTAGGPTVAVRCPNHPVAQALLRAAGVPIAAPSANRSTELSPTRAEHVLKGLGGRIDLILDGGPCPGGIESTVVDVTGGAVRVLRPGLVSVPMLEEIVGKVETASRERERPEEPARSPGQMAKHYSPKAEVWLCDWPEELLDGLEWSQAIHKVRVGVIDWSVEDEQIPLGKRDWLVWRSLPFDPAKYAARLYDTFHELDQLGVDRVIVLMPPDTPEWAAVRDRLTRAAAQPA